MGGRLPITRGTPASAPGAEGRHGAGTIQVQNVLPDHGAGDDTLIFDLRPTAGARVVFRDDVLIAARASTPWLPATSRAGRAPSST
jgi:hypothetical protein